MTELRVILHNLQDNIPRLLNARLSTHDLNCLALALRTRHLDLGTSLLADAVDLSAAGSDNVAVRAGVGEDKEADGVLLLSLLEGAVDLGAGGGDGLGRRADEHPGDLAFLGRGVQGVGLEGVVVGVGGGVVGDQRHVGAACTAAGLGDGLAGRRALAGVVDADLVVGAQTAEELAVVGDGVVVLKRDLDGLAFDLLGELEDVSLGILDVVRLTGDLDLRARRASLALAGNVDGDTELLLELTAALTTTADKQAVLVRLDLKDLSGLGLLVGNEGKDGSGELLDNDALTFETDGVTLGLGLREASKTSTSPSVRGTASLLDKRSEVGACSKLVCDPDWLTIHM